MSTLKASPNAASIAKRHNDAVAARQKRWADDEAKRRRQAIERAEPTDERLAKGDLRREVYEGALRHRPKHDLLETHKLHWRQDVVTAFSNYQADSLAADQTGLTPRYDGGGSGASRWAGGLGDAHAEKVKAFHRFDWVSRRLVPETRLLCELFILNRCPASALRSKMIEYGRKARPDMTEERSLQLLTEGMIIQAGVELACAYAAFEIEKRSRASR